MINYEVVRPSVTGWLEISLENNITDYLWKQIDKASVSVKDQLAGHISSSLNLEDEDDFFSKNVLIPAAVEYTKNFQHGYSKINHLGSGNGLSLNGFWVNYQKQHEFNPSHDHGGLFSFVVWMKIPTHYEKQHNLEFLKGMKNPVASNFEMIYIDTCGSISSHMYEMSPSCEGKMLFFPSTFKHAVYPFYECDEERVTISGNLYYA
jgi:hypothetical protein|tara:strand:+ start:193 stop:810 length:618 start_codon:yes stop_codon:yes gene_type:complete